MGDTDFLSKNSRETMKKSPRNYTKEQLDFYKVMKHSTSFGIETDRCSLLALAKALSLVIALGILPPEICEFCTEIVEFIVEQLRREVGFDDKFKLMNSEEFWAEFFPYPEGCSPDEHKQQILETFKKHRADWRKLWTVD
jgi:hypothetical protein